MLIFSHIFDLDCECRWVFVCVCVCIYHISILIMYPIATILLLNIIHRWCTMIFVLLKLLLFFLFVSLCHSVIYLLNFFFLHSTNVRKWEWETSVKAIFFLYLVAVKLSLVLRRNVKTHSDVFVAKCRECICTWLHIDVYWNVSESVRV